MATGLDVFQNQEQGSLERAAVYCRAEQGACEPAWSTVCHSSVGWRVWGEGKERKTAPSPPPISFLGGPQFWL